MEPVGTTMAKVFQVCKLFLSCFIFLRYSLFFLVFLFCPLPFLMGILAFESLFLGVLKEVLFYFS